MSSRATFCFCFHITYTPILTNRIIPIINLRFLLLIRINEKEELSRHEGADAVIDCKRHGFCKGVKGAVACVQVHVAQFDRYDANIITIIVVIIGSKVDAVAAHRVLNNKVISPNRVVSFVATGATINVIRKEIAGVANIVLSSRQHLNSRLGS